jgi:hypothetical protein
MRSAQKVDWNALTPSTQTCRYRKRPGNRWGTHLRPLLFGLDYLLVALALPFVTCGAAVDNQPESATGQARPDLEGHVSARGKTVPQATVFIFTAGPKVGTSTFCPSCYADCRKSAQTDAQGDFKIEALDPQLIFRILVVAKGYAPKFVAKVDPAEGPAYVTLRQVDLEDLTPDRS